MHAFAREDLRTRMARSLVAPVKPRRDGAEPEPCARSTPPRAGALARLLIALALAQLFVLCTPAAHASEVQWPGGAAPARSGSDPIDPLALGRWSVDGWLSTAPSRADDALREYEARARRARWSEARTLAGRAVFLRLYARFDEAQQTLNRAAALDATALEDPDVLLTQAYLAARRERWADAVLLARRALPLLSGYREPRTVALLECARWSMARGPQGLDDAIALLREAASAAEPSPMIRATLALALHRAGRDEEARQIARSGTVPMSHSGASETRRGALLPSEGEASVGAGLFFSSRYAESALPLSRALADPRAIAAWRSDLTALYASAQRAAAAPPSPPSHAVQFCGRDAQGRPRRCAP